MDNSQGIEFLDANARLHVDAENKAVRSLTQDIPASFLGNLRDKRFASVNAPMGDMHHVASIPTAVVEKWMAEGFNIYDKNVGLKAILQRLQREDLGGFMATSRSFT